MSAAPLVSSAYGHKMTRVLVYPHGLRVEPKEVVPIKPPRGFVRGKIEGFSAEAASRLREFCVTMHVPDRVPLKVTLTTRGVMTPRDWRRAMKQFRMRARRAGVPFVYRVELQKRKAPHLHAIAWVCAEPGLVPEHRQLFTEGWIECVRESGDQFSRRYAVDMGEVKDEGWLIYLALHHGKHKGEQLGWQGKQWGVVGRFMFKRRDAHEVELTDAQRYRFQRIVRRLLAGRKRIVDRCGYERDACNAHDHSHAWMTVGGKLWCAIPQEQVASHRKWRIFRRAGYWRCLGGKVSERSLPRDRAWLRCIDAALVKRALMAAVA